MISDDAAPSQQARIAVDLGAESCRVSLLRWPGGSPEISLVYRFTNGPVPREDGLCWDLPAILAGVDAGLERASRLAPEGVASIGVDGWAVDYVRLSAAGEPYGPTFCYRDPRAVRGERALHAVLPPERLRSLTAVQLQPINTLYQQHADTLDARSGRWLNLPEYLLFRWGGQPVAEFTNATHTGMLDLSGHWSPEIFAAAGLALGDAPRVVPPGTDLGAYAGPVASLRGARLIAPCCHDTASAIAAIADAQDDWAYISSGTWSLIGTVIDKPCTSAACALANFTNLGAAGGRRLLHKGIPGMWLLQQCLRHWPGETIASLVNAAAEQPTFAIAELLDITDPQLSQPGDLPTLLNQQRLTRGLPPIHAPARLARLIFDSLAQEYTAVLREVAAITGKRLSHVYIVGGGSQNELLNSLLARSSGLEVRRGLVESSTIGNLALQMAAGSGDTSAPAVRQAVAAIVPQTV